MDFAQHQNDLRAQRRANRVLSAIVAALSVVVLVLTLGTWVWIGITNEQHNQLDRRLDSVSSLGDVVARLAWKVRESRLAATEDGFGKVLGGLLREVDPLLVIDGLEVVDDHEPAPAEDAE